MSNSTKHKAVVCMTGAFLLGFSVWITCQPDQTRSLS